MSTNTEFPSMNVGTLSINTFNNGLTIMDRNTFPVSVFLKTDVSISRMILNGELIINGCLKAETLTITQLILKDQQYVVPNSGDTVSIEKTLLIIDPAGPLVALTIEMPSDPEDGTIVQISITEDIANITHTATGAIIDYPIISAIAPTTQHYYYRKVDNTWYITVSSEGPSSVIMTCIQDQSPNPNVQLCATNTALLGYFNNSVDKYLDLAIASDNVAIGFHANNSIVTGTRNISLGANALASNISISRNVAMGVDTLTSLNGGNGYNVAVGDGASTLNTSGEYNIAIGGLALSSDVSGNQLVAIGHRSLQNNSGSTNCTAVGYQSQLNNVGGTNNSSVGHSTLFANTGNNNTALGASSMANNVIGDGNTSVGYNSLNQLISGSDNTALGNAALESSLASSFNEMTAVGSSALSSNTASTECTAVGFQTLTNNTTGSNNTCVGHRSAAANIIGDNNTSLGHSTLLANIGNDNVSVGASSMLVNTTGDSNTAIGNNTLSSNITGSGNIVLGDSAGSALLLDDNICIGNIGNATDTGVVRIGTSGVHTSTIIPTNVTVGVTGSPGFGYLSLANEYVDTGGPYGDGAVIPDPTIAYGGSVISVWIIPLLIAALPTGLTVTMPAPVAPGQTMRISFAGVAGPPAVLGTGIIYTPSVDAAHTTDTTAITTGANSFASSWYVSPASGLWTRIG